MPFLIIAIAVDLLLCARQSLRRGPGIPTRVQKRRQVSQIFKNLGSPDTRRAMITSTLLQSISSSDPLSNPNPPSDRWLYTSVLNSLLRAAKFEAL